MGTAIYERVMAIVAKVSGGRVKSINLEGELKEELMLDSIQIVELFAQLENEFDTELPLQLMTAKTGREFISLLESSLTQQQI